MAVEPHEIDAETPRDEDEPLRLAALARFDFYEPEPGDILDRFARLAAQLCGATYGALALVGSDRVRFVARHAFDPVSCPREGSFFDATIRQKDIVWIADAREEQPFRNCTLASEPPHIRFFAGAPLRTPDGFAIGALCVMDSAPRPLADLSARGSLLDLAACAMSEMECWRLNRELEAATRERQASARELDVVYSTAPIGLSLIDREGRFRRINQHLADIDGRSVSEHIGRTIEDVLPDLAPLLVPITNQVIETGDPILDYQLAGRTPKEPDVERAWNASYYPVHLDDGSTGFVAAVVQEVTAAKQLADLERQSAARLRRVLDGIGSLVGLLDTDGTLLEANKTALSLASVAPEDVLGKPFAETYWWSYSPQVQAELRDAIRRARAGEAVRYDVPVRIAGGRLRTIDFQLTPLFGDDGTVINLVPSAFDVTGRKIAEAALRESESLFRETFEQSAVGIAHVSPEGRWLRVNDRLCEIVGYSREALLSRTYQDITYAQDLDTDVNNTKRLLAGEIDSYSMEKRYIRATGALVWVNLTVSLRRDAVRQPDHFIAVIEDITARKEAEQRLAAVMGELNHRVKNVLATVQTVVTHASQRAQSKEALVEAVSLRTRALANAHDLLMRSQWEGAILSALVAEEVSPYGSDRVEITGPPICLTSRAALAFCLLVHELATNAAKYGALSADSGQVRVSWSVQDTADGDVLHFRWEEQGGPSAAPAAGRGFGSEIIEHVAPREMGGTAVLAFLSGGVRFTLDAPLQRIMTSEELAREPWRELDGVSPGSVHGARVLVVEDSAMIAMDLESFLTGAGVEVLGPASSVEEALAVCGAAAIDAAFLDIDLDGEVVTPVALKLREMNVPFAFLTGYEDGGSVANDFETVPVVKKPFNDQVVLAVLSRLLPPPPESSRG